LLDSESLTSNSIEDTLRNLHDLSETKRSLTERRNRKIVRLVADAFPSSVCASFLPILVAVGLAWAQPAKLPSNRPDAIVAIADVHGDFDDFVAILQRAGLTDEENHWAGGKTTFVQVGDLLDRGPNSRKVMDLMMTLEHEAGRARGRVVSLLGNHEMMNIMGDLRYVTPADFARYADTDSEERRKTAYATYVKWRDSHVALLAELPQPMELTEPEWMARHPLGLLEQREAFAPGGIYGEWLRGHPAVAEIQGTIFLHGGIQPGLAKTTLASLDSKIHDEIKEFDSTKQYLQDENLILSFFNLQEIANVLQAEIIAEQKSRVPVNAARQDRILKFLNFQDWLSVRVDGPLWFRGYDQWNEEDGAVQIAEILKAYKATHIVVGHTVQKGGRIRLRFDDKVFLIDTGMLSSYYPGGRASALEICGDTKFTAIYRDQSVDLINSAVASTTNGLIAGNQAIRNGEPISNHAVAPPIDGVCSATASAPK
jgi:calcineurin-like phosphoesterase family protein